jgi:hypothetical protein
MVYIFLYFENQISSLVNYKRNILKARIRKRLKTDFFFFSRQPSLYNVGKMYQRLEEFRPKKEKVPNRNWYTYLTFLKNKDTEIIRIDFENIFLS